MHRSRTVLQWSCRWPFGRIAQLAAVTAQRRDQWPRCLRRTVRHPPQGDHCSMRVDARRRPRKWKQLGRGLVPPEPASKASWRGLVPRSATFMAAESGLERTKCVTINGHAFCVYARRRPSLPHGPPCSTIGAERLNFRVRNGAGCFPIALITETLWRCGAGAPDRISGTSQWTRSIFVGTSPRPISIGQLRALLHFHIRPITQ